MKNDIEAESISYKPFLNNEQLEEITFDFISLNFKLFQNPKNKKSMYLADKSGVIVLEFQAIANQEIGVLCKLKPFQKVESEVQDARTY